MNIQKEDIWLDESAVAEVRLLGRVDVPSVLALQKLMVHDVRQQSQLSASVLICEHPPSVTVGQAANLLELPAEARELESRLIRVHRVPRPGHAVLHQPGQLCFYVVVSLDEAGMTPTSLRDGLADAVIATASSFQVRAQQSDNDPNIICGRHGLIAELFLRVDDGVTSFGGYLNVSPRLDEARLVGRGLLGERLSSMNAERVRPTQPAPLRAELIENLCHRIRYPEYHIHTGHPFLTRTRKFVSDRFQNDQSTDH